jgi:hypothetical protein
MRLTKLTTLAILMFFFLSSFAFGQTQDSVKTGTVKKPAAIKKATPPATTTKKPIRQLPTRTAKTPTKRINKVPDIPLTDARITYDYTDFDFGVVPPGTQLTHHFPVRNTGPDTLVISKIKAG